MKEKLLAILHLASANKMAVRAVESDVLINAMPYRAEYVALSEDLTRPVSASTSADDIAVRRLDMPKKKAFERISASRDFFIKQSTNNYEAYHKVNNELYTSNRNLRVEIGALQTENSQLNRQLLLGQEKLQQAENSLNETLTGHAEERRRYLDYVNELREDLRRRGLNGMGPVASLGEAEDYDRLQIRLNGLERDIQQKNENIAALREKIQNLTLEVKRHKANNREIVAKFDQLREQAETMQSSGRELQGANDLLAARMQELNGEMLAARYKHAVEIKTLTAQRDNILHNFQALQEVGAKVRDEYTTLLHEKEELELAAVENEKQIKILNDKLKILNNKNSRIQLLEMEITELRAENTNSQHRIETISVTQPITENSFEDVATQTEPIEENFQLQEGSIFAETAPLTVSNFGLRTSEAQIRPVFETIDTFNERRNELVRPPLTEFLQSCAKAVILGSCFALGPAIIIVAKVAFGLPHIIADPAIIQDLIVYTTNATHTLGTDFIEKTSSVQHVAGNTDIVQTTFNNVLNEVVRTPEATGIAILTTVSIVASLSILINCLT